MRPGDYAHGGADTLVRPAERQCSVGIGFVVLLPSEDVRGITNEKSQE
jgi:hypothetical protein